MYFPGDPLFFQDPIFNSVRDEAARQRLVSAYDHDATTEEWATGYRFDLVLGGAAATPLEGVMTFTYPVSSVPASPGRRRRRPSARSSTPRCPSTPARRSWAPSGRVRSPCTATCTTGRANRSPTRWSRCGRPTRRDRSGTSPGCCPRSRPTASGASAGARRTRPAPTGSRRCVPGAVPHPRRDAAGAARRDVGLRARDAPPGRDAGLLRALPPTTRCSPRCPTTGRGTLVAAADGDGYRFDVQLQGPDETVFLDVVDR